MRARWIVVALVLIVAGTLVFLLTRLWDGAPPIADLLKTRAGIVLPASFELQHSYSYGVIECYAFYSGTLAKADAAKLIQTLESTAPPRVVETTTRGVVHFDRAPPEWWSAQNWDDRKSFDVLKGDVFLVHISPTTGRIEIEWGDF